MKSRGFTLVEMIVMIGVISIVLMSAISILMSIFKAKSGIENVNRLVSQGDYVISQLRDNVLEANPETVTCGTTIAYTTKKGRSNVLSCSSGAANTSISSNSGSLVGLMGDGGITVECGAFSSCEYISGSTKVSAVNIGFTLSMPDGSGAIVSRSFETKVVVRD